MRCLPSAQTPSSLLIFLLALVFPVHAEEAFLNRPLSVWIKDLKDPISKVRRGAAFALGKSGSATVLSAVVQVLGDGEAGVREAAAYALGELAADGHGTAVWIKAGPKLLTLLAKDPNPRVRRSAAFAAGCCGTEAVDARPGLLAALTDGEPMVRQNAAWALGQMGREAGPEVLAGLVGVLGDSDAVVRRDAALALGDLGKPAARIAVPALLACAQKETEASVRKVALDSLVKLVAPQNQNLVGELNRFLEGGDDPVARAAALALGKIGGPEAKEAVPILKRVLLDDDASVRELAAGALGNIGPAAAPAVSVLVTALADRSAPVRRNAALALARIGPEAAPAVPALARVLDTGKEPEDVRMYVAEALGKIGQGLDPVVDILLRTLKTDDNQVVRQRLIFALLQVEDRAHSSAIVAALEAIMEEKSRENLLVRYDAARALAMRLHDRTPPRVAEVLLEMLQDKNLRIYFGSDSTLKTGDERSGSKTSVNENRGGDARFLAAEALAEMGKAANRPKVIEALKDAVRSTDEEMQKAAEIALKQIQRAR